MPTQPNRDTALSVVQTTDLAVDSEVFASYLQRYGLPTDNVIASTEQRTIVAGNLPHFLTTLSAEQKNDARYLSKFLGATAIGLFDAALNYVWNEVVLTLRRKTEVYGVDLFFDAAVGGNQRAAYKDASDLPGLKDKVLLDTCLKLELISDVVYRKLDHILTMRNEIAASHPNVAQIGGYELLGWLQTCVNDVLKDQPSASAIRIRSIVDNLKGRTDVLDQLTVDRFASEVANLSQAHANNLLITIFGIFSHAATGQIVKKNISLLAKHIWNASEDRVRSKIGVTIDGYRTNLQADRLQSGVEFLQLVDGLRYESMPAKAVALSHIADRLESCHVGRDNFYTEPPVMQEVFQFCQTAADIPEDVLPRLIKVVLRCRIGRGLTYCDGVSPTGLGLYDKFIRLLNDNGIVWLVISLFDPEVNAKLGNPICQRHLAAVLQIAEEISVSARLKQIIQFLRSDIVNAHKASSNREFRQLSSPLITWK